MGWAEAPASVIDSAVAASSRRGVRGGVTGLVVDTDPDGPDRVIVDLIALSPKSLILWNTHKKQANKQTVSRSKNNFKDNAFLDKRMLQICSMRRVRLELFYLTSKQRRLWKTDYCVLTNEEAGESLCRLKVLGWWTLVIALSWASMLKKEACCNA